MLGLIPILAAFIILGNIGVRSLSAQAADVVVKGDINQISTALVSYLALYGRFPENISEMERIDQFQGIGSQYHYLVSGDGQDASLFVKLSDGKFWCWRYKLESIKEVKKESFCRS